MLSSPPEGKCVCLRGARPEGAGETWGQRRLRAGLLRGQAFARKSPPSQQGSRVIPPPHASSLGPASLGTPSPHTPWTPPPPHDQHFSAAPCGRARTKAQRGTTYSPRHEAPSPPQRPERGRREWAAGKAGEAGHHAPRGLSHSNSPWGDAAGGQRAGDAAAKGVCGGGFGGARLSYGRGLGPRRRVQGRAMEKDMAEMGAERRDRLGEIDAQTCTEAEAVRGGQRGPGRGPQRCRARGPPCPTPHPAPCAHLVAPESHVPRHSQRCWAPPAARVPLPRPAVPPWVCQQEALGPREEGPRWRLERRSPPQPGSHRPKP